MTRLIIHFKNDDVRNKPQPWPVGVDPDYRVTSGLGPDDGAILIGFGPVGEQRVTVARENAILHPQDVIGLAPSFSKNDGLFEWALPISTVEVLP